MICEGCDSLILIKTRTKCWDSKHPRGHMTLKWSGIEDLRLKTECFDRKEISTQTHSQVWIWHVCVFFCIAACVYVPSFLPPSAWRVTRLLQLRWASHWYNPVSGVMALPSGTSYLLYIHLLCMLQVKMSHVIQMVLPLLICGGQYPAANSKHNKWHHHDLPR